MVPNQDFPSSIQVKEGREGGHKKGGGGVKSRKGQWTVGLGEAQG